MSEAPSDIQLLVLDVDGVLTDGSIWYDDAGQEFKRFHVRDGSGMVAWMRMGLKIAVITGRGGPAVMHRMRDLGVTCVRQRVRDKARAVVEVCQELRVRPSRTACMGDDWTDLPMMRAVAYSIAPADAEAVVRDAASWVTTRAGGQGAVREAIEHLLDAQGLLDRARESF